MKPSRQLSIYIAASAARHLHAANMLRDMLREEGHMVRDWAALGMPLPKGQSPRERRASRDADDDSTIFAFCADAAVSSDLVIYLGESGQDAACAAALAYASGVPVFGLRGLYEEPGTIMRHVVGEWHLNLESLLRAVKRLAEANAETDAP